MEACSQRSSLHFYAVDVAGNTYSNGSKKATAVCVCVCVRGLGMHGHLTRLVISGRWRYVHIRVT